MHFLNYSNMLLIIIFLLIAALFILVAFYNILSYEKYKQRQKFNTYIDAIYKKQPLVIEKTSNAILIKITNKASYHSFSEDFIYNKTLEESYLSLFEEVKRYVKDNIQVDSENKIINVELKLIVYDRREQFVQFTGRTTRDNEIESTRVG